MNSAHDELAELIALFNDGGDRVAHATLLPLAVWQTLLDRESAAVEFEAARLEALRVQLAAAEVAHARRVERHTADAAAFSAAIVSARFGAVSAAIRERAREQIDHVVDVDELHLS